MYIYIFYIGKYSIVNTTIAKFINASDFVQNSMHEIPIVT